MLPAPPAKVNLAHTPTPLQPLPRLSRELGVELYIKRDDLTGCALSGNKVRKLEFVLARVLESGADTVLTCGKVQSNHARATALAAARLGLKTRLILRTPDGRLPAEPEGNLLLDLLAGAEVVPVDFEAWERREEIMAAQAAEMEREGRKVFTIPFGASDLLGAWGEINAAGELKNDLAALPGGLTTETGLVLAAGSGGALAGYALGLRWLGIPVRPVGINVDDYGFILRTVGRVAAEAGREYGGDQTLVQGRDFELIDGYVGRGYALSTPEELDFLARTARLEGLVLDPVYTAKALLGLIKELKKNPESFGKRVVFLHTGGIFHLFSQVPGLRAVLGGGPGR